MKLSFNNEIHKILNIPSNFQQLLDLIKTKFAQDLPQKWIAEYIDSDGDHISITSEEDFQVFLTTTPQDAFKSLKIFVKPLENLGNSQSQFMNQSVQKEDFKKEEEKFPEEEKMEVDSLAESQIKSEAGDPEKSAVDKKEAYQNKIKDLNEKLKNPKLNDERKNKILTQLQQVEEKLKAFLQKEEQRQQKLEKKAQAQKQKRKSQEKKPDSVNASQIQKEGMDNSIAPSVKSKEAEKIEASRNKIKELNEQLANLPDEQKNQLMIQVQQEEDVLQELLAKEEWMRQKVEKKRQAIEAENQKSQPEDNSINAFSQSQQEEVKIDMDSSIAQSVKSEEVDKKEAYRNKIKELNEKLGASQKLPDEKKHRLMVQLQQAEEKLKVAIQKEEERKQRLEKKAQMQASKIAKPKEKAVNESGMKESAKPQQDNVEEEKLGESVVVEEKDQKKKYEEKIKELNEKLAGNLPDERKNKIMVQLREVEEKLKAFLQREEDKKQRLEKRKAELEAKKSQLNKKKAELNDEELSKMKGKEEEEKISEKAQKALDDIEIQVQMAHDEEDDDKDSSRVSSYGVIE